MITTARQKWPAATNVRWLLGDVLDSGLALVPSGYDVVTAGASLDHLPLRAGLGRFRQLLRPGGTLTDVRTTAR